MVYLKSVENVITLGKLIGLLFLFCLPLLSILFLKTKRNDLAHPVMGTIFLVRYICTYIAMWFVRHFFNGIFLSTICIRELVKTYEGQMQFTGEGWGGRGMHCLAPGSTPCIVQSDSSIL